MTDFTVSQYGVDTSGRAILMTAYAHSIRERVLADPRVAPFAHKVVLVQGCFMSRIPGGGATASAGFHDLAGCWDDRSRDLTAAELAMLVRVYRENGVAAYPRDEQHGGMDRHLHNLLGTDRPLAYGATWQWQEYLAGRDGLATRGPDYCWRPDPLVTTPPEDDMPFTEAELRAIVSDELDKANARLLNTKVGNDDTTFKQVLNKLKTWLARN